MDGVVQKSCGAQKNKEKEEVREAMKKNNLTKD